MSIIKKIKDKFPSTSKLEKLTFTGYEDETFKNKTGEFQVMFNPNALNLRFQVDRTETQEQGQTHPKLNFNGMKPIEFSLEFILDGTGINGDMLSKTDLDKKISARVNEYLEVVYGYNGRVHQNQYVRIKYGAVLLECILVSTDINYTLFDRSGQPLRAKINASFKTVKSRELSEIIANKQSPDLTHVRELKQSDKFTLMANAIYEENFLFTRVARANQLNSFRNVPTGTRLIFPPLINKAE